MMNEATPNTRHSPGKAAVQAKGIVASSISGLFSVSSRQVCTAVDMFAVGLHENRKATTASADPWRRKKKGKKGRVMSNQTQKGCRGSSFWTVENDILQRNSWQHSRWR